MVSLQAQKVPTNGKVNDSNPSAPIKPGGPLLITISSVFPGSEQYHRSGDLLITSQVKNSHIIDAGPIGLNYHFDGDEVPAGREVPIHNAGYGTDVIYYTPGLTDRSLNVQVSLRYSSFDSKMISAWVDTAVSVAQLPVFVTPLGPVGMGLVSVGATLVKLAVDRFHNLTVGDNDWTAYDLLAFDLSGVENITAGYFLFTEDPEGQRPQEWELELDGSETPIEAPPKPQNVEFEVDEHGRLTYKESKELVLEGPPYVLVHVSGEENKNLNKWQAAALTSKLSERFMKSNEDRDPSDDVLTALSSYNDLVTLKDIDDLDELLKGDLSATKRKAVQAQRDGAIKRLQNDEIAKLFKK